FPGCAGPLLAHLAEHEPSRLQRAEIAGYPVDAIVHRLTGAITIDASDASLPFLDTTTRRYSEQALRACGIAHLRSLLVEPAPLGTMFGLSAPLASSLGLPSGLPVSAAPFDLPACALGAGVSQVGDGTVVVGTTLGAEVLTDTVLPGTPEEPAGMWLAIPRENRWLRAMPAMVGTANLDWVLSMVGATTKDLDELLAASPPGANGVSALSFLSASGERAPFVDPLARGQFTGLTMATSRADLVRALCEAVAYAARHNLAACGCSGELSACGGGARSSQWSQIFADVIGTPIHIPRELGVGILGAAMTAWDSLGAPIDAEAWRADRRVVTPDPATVEYYQHGYREYLNSVGRARGGWHYDD
ncbi:MAG: FGGY-family carbohydrate kinase, partial [Sciscionella sp.]